MGLEGGVAQLVECCRCKAWVTSSILGLQDKEPFPVTGFEPMRMILDIMPIDLPYNIPYASYTSTIVGSKVV